MKKLILKNISIICAICLIICLTGGFVSGTKASSDILAANVIAENTKGEIEAAGNTAEDTAAALDQTASSAVVIYYNGIRMTDGVKIEDTTYVSLRAFLNVIGDQTDIAWDPDTDTVAVTGENLEMTAAVGTNYMIVNDRCFYLPKGVLVINGSLCLPVRELSKVFQAQIIWDDNAGAVSITADEPEVIEGGEDYYNSEDLYWLSHLINAEAGNQSIEGKIGVGNVVLNRVADPNCPDTVYGVIFDTKYGVQFSVTTNGTIDDEPNEESILAAKICLEGYNIVEDSIYFVNPEVGISSWFAQTRIFVVNIGQHDFYA
ncbi:MAG: cell wall hydrolase [Oscillospiraceae bacterium]|nr:cell wall hydrolase [Oscillospiraceae bacterium]